MKKTQYSLLAISIALASQVHAAGFQVVEHSASGLGRAFSGAGAVGDNASEMSANAASMMLFDKKQFSGAASWIEPEIDVKNNTLGDSADDVAPSHFVPALYYVNPINDKWAWGIGMYTDYGVSTDYPSDFLAGAASGHTSLTTFKFNPNIAYRINDQFSIGAGFDLVYAKAELKRTVGALAPSIPGTTPSSTLIKMEGDTFGYGWNVGALYEINENNRFSASYKSAVKLKFEDGDFTDGTGALTGQPGSTNDADLDIELPDIVILSGFHQLNNQWAVHYSWQWTNYSKFSELTATGDACIVTSGTCFNKKEDYSDNQRWSIGTTYQPTDSLILRAGFAYDEQAGKATLSIPDTDRYWYTAGMTYLWTEDLSLDAGFAYIDGKSGNFSEELVQGNPATTNNFNSSGPAYIGSVQLNYTF
ncbi:outer membrane protein transport protein [Vibrio algivorus]|uniref:Long-chain fatty acid outer membrane transporter n=1 Tax=Vibrio algivorus TaxID=1667024 RepID=A0ABQ6ESI1_9VIBR|nr:outer membrane protein transport protein [Vibrio algivorus]GLT15932.1 long-chain fatty acid outer membrane transporter [Vibrio algivorus]